MMIPVQMADIGEEIQELFDKNVVMQTRVDAVPAGCCDPDCDCGGSTAEWETLMEYVSKVAGITMRNSNTCCAVCMDADGKVVVKIWRDEKLLQEITVDAK